MTKINQTAASFTPKASRDGVIYRPDLSDFVAPDNAQNFALCSLLDVLASNNPEEVVRREGELVTVLQQVAETLNLLGMIEGNGGGCRPKASPAIAGKYCGHVLRCKRRNCGRSQHFDARGRP